MLQSSKPRKQRHFRFNAPMHARGHFVHAHVDKELRNKMGLKRRAIQISKGDTVKVMVGSNKGTSGKVTRVSLRTGRILIDSLRRKNAKGKEFNLNISASNVYITALNLSDKVRAARLKLKQQVEEKKPVAKEVPKPVAPQQVAEKPKLAEVAQTVKQ